MLKAMKLVVMVGFLLTCLAVTGQTQPVSSRHGVGPFMGYSSNPDQFVIGGQLHFGPEGSPIHFVPGLDFGFGDDITVTTLNFDVTYDFVPTNGNVVFFVGAGPTIAFYSADEFDGATEAGLTLSTGVKFPTWSGNAWNLGARIGVGDIPDVKLQVGYVFGFR